MRPVDNTATLTSNNTYYSLQSAALPDVHLGVMVPQCECVIPSGRPGGMDMKI